MLPGRRSLLSHFGIYGKLETKMKIIGKVRDMRSRFRLGRESDVIGRRWIETGTTDQT